MIFNSMIFLARKKLMPTNIFYEKISSMQFQTFNSSSIILMCTRVGEYGRLSAGQAGRVRTVASLTEHQDQPASGLRDSNSKLGFPHIFSNPDPTKLKMLILPFYSDLDPDSFWSLL